MQANAMMQRIQGLEIALMEKEYENHILKMMLVHPCVPDTQPSPVRRTSPPGFDYTHCPVQPAQSKTQIYETEGQLGCTNKKTKTKMTQTKPKVTNAGIQVEMVKFTTRLDDDELTVIKQLKFNLITTLNESYYIFAEVQGTATLIQTAFSCLICDPLCHWRKELMDVIVLDIVESHGCSNMETLEEAFKDLVGNEFNSNWLSLLHQSIRKVLEDNGIHCFPTKNKKKCRDAKLKVKLDTGAM